MSTVMAPPQQEERLPDDAVSPMAAARAIDVHPNTVRRWIDKGLVAGWRRGFRTFVSLAEVRAQIRRVKPAAAKEDGAVGGVRTPEQDEAAAEAAKRRIARKGW